MKLFKRKHTANEWRKVFAFLPKRIVTLETKGEVRIVTSHFFWLCFVDRRFSVVKGIFTGVEYRERIVHVHGRCVVNCGLPGCEAPIGLNLERLQRHTK